MRTSTRQRTPVPVDDGALAKRIGARLKESRLRAGLTQQQLAAERYTKAYVSALENGLVRPSMAALTFFAERLRIPASRLLGDEAPAWSRLEADLHLAAGRWTDASDAYTALLEALPESTAEPARRAELLNGRAEAAARTNQAAQAVADASEAARIFTAEGREVDAAIATYWLANGQYEQDNLVEARALLRSILDRVRAGLRVAPDFEFRVLMALSTVESKDGEHARALAYLQEVKGVADGLDDRRRAIYLFDLAYSYRETGDIEGALLAGHRSLALFQASGAETEIAAIENNLALAYLAVGNLPRAAEYSGEARRRFERISDRRWLAHIEDTGALIALQEGRAAAALEMTERAIAHAEATDNQGALMSSYVTRARAHVALEELSEAQASYERAAELVRIGGPRSRLREILGEWADLLAESGQHERAYALTREALASG
jgi:tetratricopeptide (TPR) repeat protein